MNLSELIKQQYRLLVLKHAAGFLDKVLFEKELSFHYSND